MEARCGGNGLLPDRVHQPERTEILEHARAACPRYLAVLHSSQCVEHRFVGIRGHLDSFLKCSDNAKRRTGRGLRPPKPPPILEADVVRRRVRAVSSAVHKKTPYPNQIDSVRFICTSLHRFHALPQAASNHFDRRRRCCSGCWRRAGSQRR
ncbi:hypothetical protein BCPG_00304 [Burkholderia cenocepacia PC184]|nr:hypothetical protein BCPG_00304 [Burkholderia cenocepacia PC184]